MLITAGVGGGDDVGMMEVAMTVMVVVVMTMW